MAADYTCKANTVPGPLVIALAFSDATTPDLTAPGTTATFRMRPQGANPAIIDALCIIVDATHVAYPWS